MEERERPLTSSTKFKYASIRVQDALVYADKAYCCITSESGARVSVENSIPTVHSDTETRGGCSALYISW